MNATFLCFCNLNHVLTWLLINFFLLLDFSSLATAQSGGMAPTQPSPYPFKQTISKRMALVLIILVCFFIFIAVLSVYTRQCSDRRHGGRLGSSAAQGGNNNQSRRRTRGLDAAVIATFPTFVYSNVKRLKIGKGSLECAVCLCEFEDDETLRLLPKCSHVFHSNCIDAWLVSHSTCPVCRASLVPKPGDISFAALLNSDSGIDGNQINGSENGQVVVQISEDDQGQDHVGLISPNHQSRPVRSRSAGWRLAGIFPRSHSTGNYERFTLRLPEEVRSELVVSNLNRARSCVALPRMQSSRQGFRNGSGKNTLVSSRSGRSEWRTFFPMTPSFRKEGSRTRRDEMNGNVDGGDRPFARLTQ